MDAGLGSLPDRVTTEMTLNTTPAMMAVPECQYLSRRRYGPVLTDRATSRVPLGLFNLSL